MGVALQDFVSCADLYPFLIALYVAESHCKKGIAQRLIRHAKNDCQAQKALLAYISALICVDSMSDLNLHSTRRHTTSLATITASINAT
ncbi:hypothetical protein [uncultured Helicobacter sp.]|uniref:GNAT family N-acetyltransferase n=1 Tax=uncultured Helicobacter sp. TaxID=175537 RepID=UPI00260DE279|nr:hypothetical protein [uncultured Helicobacter sp.]